MGNCICCLQITDNVPACTSLWRSASPSGWSFDKRAGVTYSPATPGHTPEIAGVLVGAMPMTRVEVLFLATYFLVLLVLAIYVSHRYVMAYLFNNYKDN